MLPLSYPASVIYTINPSLNSYSLSCKASESLLSKRSKQPLPVDQNWKIKETHQNHSTVIIIKSRTVYCSLKRHTRARTDPPLQSQFLPLTFSFTLLQPHRPFMFFKHIKNILISSLYICCDFFFESISLIFLQVWLKC